MSDINHELAEARSEIARHHRDLARISSIVAKALTWDPMTGYARNHKAALMEIQGIVG